MSKSTKTGARSAAKKPTVYADVFPNVVVIHEGDPESPLHKIPLIKQLNADDFVATFLAGLRVKNTVKLRRFTATGVEIK